MARELCGGGGFYSSYSNIQTRIPTGFGPGGEPAEFFNLGSTGGGGGGDGFHQNMMVVEPWGTAALDDSSLRCLFPYEPNERPSQGLSLSLSSSNFPIFQLPNSKFLGPAQELLYEFCSLDSCCSSSSPKHKGNRPKKWELMEDYSSNSRKLSLQSSLDFLELQKRKTNLFSMLEEVERRYKHYIEQMKVVVASFEAVAGSGAARVYSAQASKAMSRHFRCLKDGIVGEIKATKKAMGEKDAIAPGTTSGETPRLRVIDQALRQQRAFHQMSSMDSQPWRPQRGLPERSVSALRAWLFEHFLHPYPSDVDKHILARQTGLSRSQVSNWFINARVRLWKPMVEEMYLEETKEQEQEINNNGDNSSDGVEVDFDNEIDRNQLIPTWFVDQKPTSDQLLKIDSECLSSIISNNSEKNDSRVMKTIQNRHHLHHNHDQTFDAFGAMELDFSSYNNHSGNDRVSFPNNNSQHFNNGGSSSGNVSLTLGLQQHATAGRNGGGEVSIAFSSTAGEAQSSIFMTRDQVEDCQQVQYSLYEGEAQNLPYRNLMGAQLLHDLVG